MYDITARLRKIRNLEKQLRADKRREKNKNAARRKKLERLKARDYKLMVEKQAKDKRDRFITHGMQKMNVLHPTISVYATEEYKTRMLNHHKRISSLTQHFNNYVDIINHVFLQMSKKLRKYICKCYFDECKTEIWKRMIKKSFADKTLDEQYEKILLTSCTLMEQMG